MQRSSNLYKNIYIIDNVRDTYKIIKRECNNKKSVYNYDLYEGINLYSIVEKLYNRTYKFSKYHIFLIKEPKYRLIMSENINDKIVNHLISNYILLPALEPKLIDTNVATRKNKGSKYALDMLNKYLNEHVLKNQEIYVLKMDISKYFYNIDHDILKSMLKKDIKDKDALDIIFKTLDTTNEEYINKEIKRLKIREIERIKKLNINIDEKKYKIDEINKIPLYRYNKGLGIGNMTIQILAIYYLSGIDNYIKRVLKCKYYIRYMDDLIIIDNNINKLKEIFNLLILEIKKINLDINNKSRIINLKRGLSFLGYTYIHTNNRIIVKINNDTKKRIKKHLKYVNYDIKSVNSYKGFLKRVKY